MNKNIIAAAIFASLSAIVTPVHAIDLDKTAQGYVDFFASSKCDTEACDLNAALTTAITEFPIFAEPLLAAALKAVGPNTAAAKKLVATAVAALGKDSTLTANLLESATEAGVNFETDLVNECHVNFDDDKELDIADTKDCDFLTALENSIAEDPTSAEALVAAAITAAGADSEMAESIIASAITALGPDSALIPSILTIATNAGVNSDTVTGIAIASGVDATIASDATAAGPGTGTGTGNNTVTTNRGGANNGGGGGGISTNQ